MKKNDSDYALNINLTCIYPLEGDSTVTARVKDSDGIDIECKSSSNDPDEALGDVIFDLISALSEPEEDDNEGEKQDKSTTDFENKIKEYQDKIKSLEIDNNVLNERLKDAQKRLNDAQKKIDCKAADKCRCSADKKATSARTNAPDKAIKQERPKHATRYIDIYDDLLSSFFESPFVIRV